MLTLKVTILTIMLKNYIVLELSLYLASSSMQKLSFRKESGAKLEAGGVRKVGTAALQTSEILKEAY